MKWALASVGLLTLIVVFSLAALDQKNVVWSYEPAPGGGGELVAVPHCPHCRSVVGEYSNLCATCRQAFDWETHEELCPACLSTLDAEWLRRRAEGRETDLRAAFANAGIPEEAVPDLLNYLKSIGPGDCGFCGGTGRWLAPGVHESPTTNGDRNTLTAFLRDELGKERCPVCLGSGRCVLCGDDHRVVWAREASARELAETEKKLAVLDPYRDRESALARWDAIRSFLSGNIGMHEVALLPSFDEMTETHLKRATRRLAQMREIVSNLP